MPLGIDKKLRLNVALNIIKLQQSLLKLEDENFYIDCGGWVTWREAIQIARKEGKDKKFVIFTQPEEEMAHEEECMCLAFGVGKENPSLDEIRIVGKQVYAFLDSEGFEMGWDEDPDSYITIGLDKDLQNAKDPFHLVLEIHVPDEDVIKEKVKNLGFYTAPNSFNKCLNLALPFKDGESVWDVLKRNVFDWKDILRYSIYLENEEDQIDIMPTWNFYADWLENYLELSEKKSIKQIPDSEEVTRIIKILYLNKKINEATLQCFTIVAEGLKSNELLEEKEEFFNDISSIDSFKNQIKRGLTPLEEETEVWEVIAQRFKIGESLKYRDLTEFLDDLNYEIMLKVFNGSIKEKFTKMKPVSVNAFFIHLYCYSNEVCKNFHKKKISSATYSAITIFLDDSDPDAYGLDETFLEEEFSGLFDWVSTEEGILDYLETRYHEAVDDPLEGDDETWLFYIGDSSSCPYKNYQEFKSELDINMILKIFRKCWERSCKYEYPKGRQLTKDFPEFKTDFSNYKKLKGEELLGKIEKDILPRYENIKSYGYNSTNKNSDDIALVEDFFIEHTKALKNKKNSGFEIPDYEFPAKWKIGNLPRGKYLIGDFEKVLRIADKKIVNELKSFEKQTDVPDDEYFLSPYNFEEFLKKEKGIDPNEGVIKLSPDRQFIMIAPGVDESSFSDDNGGRYFQSSNCIICIKVDDNYINREANINSYVFENDFECSYFEDYDVLKLGDLHVYADY